MNRHGANQLKYGGMGSLKCFSVLIKPLQRKVCGDLQTLAPAKRPNRHTKKGDRNDEQLKISNKKAIFLKAKTAFRKMAKAQIKEEFY